MKEDLKKLHESKNYDEIYNLIETKFSQFESRWNSVLASEEGVKLYRNLKLSDSNRDKIYRKMFAELIVQECIDITSGLSKLFPRTDVSFDVGYTMGTTRATKEIKKHFGVEE
jgi:hypothetical protein